MLVEALWDAEVLADSDALVEALCEADVLADSLALVDALCDAEVLADSETLVEALCEAEVLADAEMLSDTDTLIESEIITLSISMLSREWIAGSPLLVMTEFDALVDAL